MNLYKITRNDTEVDNWEEYEGFVIRSKSQDSALKTCQELATDYFSKTTYFIDVTIELLAENVSGEEEIILSDYTAG